jgi:hypothetical protein
VGYFLGPSEAPLMASGCAVGAATSSFRIPGEYSG